MSELVKTISTRKRILTERQEPLFPLAARTSVNGEHKLWFDRNGLPACTSFSRPGGRFCAICGNCVIMFKVNQDADVICSACVYEAGTAEGAGESA